MFRRGSRCHRKGGWLVWGAVRRCEELALTQLFYSKGVPALMADIIVSVLFAALGNSVIALLGWDGEPRQTGFLRRSKAKEKEG